MPRPNPALLSYIRNRGFSKLVHTDRSSAITLNDKTAYLSTMGGSSAGAYGTTVELDATTYFILDHPILSKLDESYNPLF